MKVGRSRWPRVWHIESWVSTTIATKRTGISARLAARSTLLRRVSRGFGWRPLARCMKRGVPTHVAHTFADYGMLAQVNDPTTWLTLDFWREIIHQTMTWAVSAVPKVLVVLVLAIILLKVVSVTTSRIATRAVDKGATDSVADALEHKKRVETLLGIVTRLLQVGIWALAIVLVLMQVGVNVAPIIAGAGVVGIAVGFGAQELVRDVVSGFFQLIENHVRKGDVAVINGTGGVVENIGLRTIVLRDMAGVVHVFQNGKIETLANMTKTWSAMVFDIGVAYQENVDRVIEIVGRIGEELRTDPELGPKILEPMEVFGVEAFEENAVIIKARIKTIPIEQWTVGREYRRRLKAAFDAERIEMPYSRVFYVGDPSSQQLQSRNGAPTPQTRGGRANFGGDPTPRVPSQANTQR